MLRHIKKEKCISLTNCISSKSTKNRNWERSWRKEKGNN